MSFIRMPVRSPRSVRDWASADAFLGLKDDRPLPGRFTRLKRRNIDSIAVRYHGTDVVTFTREGRVILDSGGWHTPTTRSRWREYVRGLQCWGDGNEQSAVSFQQHTYRILGAEKLELVTDPLLVELVDSFGMD